MLRNYLTVALRILFHNKVFSFINIFGLAAGMAVSILIFIWARDELSYDRFFPEGDRLYKLLTRDTANPDIIQTTSPFPLAPSLYELYPGFENYTRFWLNSVLIKYKDKPYFERQMALVDTGFFRMFSVEFIKGNPETALTELTDVVLTESTAAGVFKDEDPIGKIIKTKDQQYTVRAVIKDPPGNSHLQYHVLGHIDNVPELRLKSWYFAGPSYIMIQKSKTKKEMEDQIFDFYRSIDPETTGYPCLQRVSDVYLNELGCPGKIQFVILFSVIAVLILVIACINYMNLTTAYLTKRAKETGIRKITGATRRHIIIQYYVESLVQVILAFLIAFILVELLRPVFNQLTAKQLTISYIDPIMLIGFAVILVLTLIFSGSYPALLGSAFNSVIILRGGFNKGLKGKMFRSILVVFQFLISILLIIITLYISKQLHYIHNKDLGYHYENVLTIPYNADFQKNFDELKNELLDYPGILEVSATSLLPNDITWQVELNWEGNPGRTGIPIEYLMVDYDFTELMEMEIIQGRSFSHEFSTDDSIAYIINETAARKMGISNPVGLKIEFIHNEFPERFRKGYIIGVVKDFISRPLNYESGAVAMRIYRPWYQFILIRIDTRDVLTVISHIGKTAEKFAPDYPFEYKFFNESFDEIYLTEIRMGSILKYFTFIAILISILGLYGQAYFALAQRTKEIAIRKVNGGSFDIIMRMLFIDFTKLVLLAFVFAIPVAYFIIKRMIQDYVDHTPVSWWIFAVSGGIAVIIAIITVFFHTYRVSVSNPSENLRYE
jgi:putative ABC transport system permease protein